MDEPPSREPRDVEPEYDGVPDYTFDPSEPSYAEFAA
jgi:hypothetical protein